MKDRIAFALSRYEAQDLEPDLDVPPAAVLLLIYENEGKPHIVFQRRTDSVEHHKGQISFPGGGRDPEDRDLIHTALRETHEEIGVHPDDIEILGRIDEMRTISNFRVTPYVGWLGRYPYEWRFNDEEVAYLLEVPLAHLQDPSTLTPDKRVINGREIVLPSYPFGPDLIWGATARMLTNVLDVLRTLDE